MSHGDVPAPPGPADRTGDEEDRAVFPVGLRLRGRRVLVAGGGPVALRRIGALRATGADVHLVSPTAVAALDDLASRGEIRWDARPVDADDVEGAWLVLACTDDPVVNADLAAAADAAGVWCARADDAEASRAWIPARGSAGGAVVAVHGARDVARAVRMRDAAVRAVETLDAGSGRPPVVPGQGRVVLVGGGPGDAGLLTRRGMQRLAEAHVVVTDRLAPVGALEDLASDVVVVDVSKVPKGRTTPQEQINDLLVRHALAGRTVVRLKGGDPFVFGRGMEEVLACTQAGVRVEVVPGVTSAVAVPALAGIPLTHRGMSQGVTVVSGHVPPGDPRSTLDWALLARTGTTLVVLMAVDTLPAVTAALLAGGLAASTPVACVRDGGLPTQWVFTGRLDDVAPRALAAGLAPPAVTVIGDVASFAVPSPLR